MTTIPVCVARKYNSAGGVLGTLITICSQWRHLINCLATLQGCYIYLVSGGILQQFGKYQVPVEDLTVLTWRCAVPESLNQLITPLWLTTMQALQAWQQLILAMTLSCKRNINKQTIKKTIDRASPGMAKARMASCAQVCSTCTHFPSHGEGKHVIMRTSMHHVYALAASALDPGLTLTTKNPVSAPPSIVMPSGVTTCATAVNTYFYIKLQLHRL